METLHLPAGQKHLSILLKELEADGGVLVKTNTGFILMSRVDRADQRTGLSTAVCPPNDCALMKVRGQNTPPFGFP